MKYMIRMVFVTIVLLIGSFFLKQYIDTLIDPATIDVEVVGVFLGVFGMIYAIVIGFGVFIASERYNGLVSAIEDETNALDNIMDLFLYIDNQDDVEKEIEGHFRTYVKHIKEDEWVTMQSGQYSDKAKESIKDLMTSVNGVQVTKPTDEIALNALVEKTLDLTTYRTTRVSLSSQSLSKMLRWLLNFLSVALLLGFLFLPFGHIIIEVFMIVIVVVSIVLLHYVVDDLDGPFDGIWQVSNAPYDRVLARENLL